MKDERRVASAAQLNTLASIWKRARDLTPDLRSAATHVHEDTGALCASWGFTDIPGYAFTLEIHTDGSVEWFFKGAMVYGSEDPVDTLPDEAVVLLATSFGSRQWNAKEPRR